MDGAASPQASAEAGGAADLDPRRPAAAAVVVPLSPSPFFELNPVQDSLHRFLAIDRRVLFSGRFAGGGARICGLVTRGVASTAPEGSPPRNPAPRPEADAGY